MANGHSHQPLILCGTEKMSCSSSRRTRSRMLQLHDLIDDVDAEDRFGQTMQLRTNASLGENWGETMMMMMIGSLVARISRISGRSGSSLSSSANIQQHFYKHIGSATLIQRSSHALSQQTVTSRARFHVSPAFLSDFVRSSHTRPAQTMSAVLLLF